MIEIKIKAGNIYYTCPPVSSRYDAQGIWFSERICVPWDVITEIKKDGKYIPKIDFMRDQILH